MSDHDRHFFDQFMLVLTLLIAFTLAMFFLARYISGNTQGEWIKDEPRAQGRLQERIAPVGTVAVAGDEDVAAPSPEEVSLAAAVPAKEVLSGVQVYNSACFACHASGAAGAPKLGNPGAWSARISQGIEVLNGHAINGYTGSSGFMPAKGGQATLSDEEVIAAVQYMVDEAS